LEISLWVHIILQSTINIIGYTTIMISLDEIYCAFERLPTKWDPIHTSPFWAVVNIRFKYLIYSQR
jgi:hypothetical protein